MFVVIRQLYHLGVYLGYFNYLVDYFTYLDGYFPIYLLVFPVDSSFTKLLK